MIYVVLGPTGVGKTRLSVELAKRLGNSIILNADSMQIYKEMNIGTAKIKEEEKEDIPHYLFDIVSIKEDFNVYNYQKLGRKLLKEGIDKNIIIVGGTGLYIKALLYDYTFDKNGNKNKELYPHKLIGLTRDRKNLYKIINDRVDIMFEEGLIEEVKKLYEEKIDTRAVKTAIGYKELYEYFDGKTTLEEAKEKIKKNSRHYAKRQYTFFNNQFKNITWYNVDSLKVSDIVEKIVSNK